MNTKNIDKIFERVQDFKGESLRSKIALLEKEYQGITKTEIQDINTEFLIDSTLLNNSFEIKNISAQINEVVHSVGILFSLPYILEKGERIQSLSLGAGNTGRNFDLETNLRVVEFKFIRWQGSSDTIRQNQIFKDFYNLAEYETEKIKELYVINKSIPIKFLNGSRALSSVMSKNKSLWDVFQNKYNHQYKVVKDYFIPRRGEVNIIDLSEKSDVFNSQIVSKIQKREKKAMRKNMYKKESSANQVREYVIEKYIMPARELNRKIVRVNSRNIHDELDYENRFPTVCQALDADKFLVQAKVRLVSRKGPKNGRTVLWVFEV